MSILNITEKKKRDWKHSNKTKLSSRSNKSKYKEYLVEDDYNLFGTIGDMLEAKKEACERTS